MSSAQPPSCCFSDFFQFLIFSILIMMHPGVIFFLFILLWGSFGFLLFLFSILDMWFYKTDKIINHCFQMIFPTTPFPFLGLQLNLISVFNTVSHITAALTIAASSLSLGLYSVSCSVSTFALFSFAVSTLLLLPRDF